MKYVIFLLFLIDVDVKELANDHILFYVLDRGPTFLEFGLQYFS